MPRAPNQNQTTHLGPFINGGALSSSNTHTFSLPNPNPSTTSGGETFDIRYFFISFLCVFYGFFLFAFTCDGLVVALDVDAAVSCFTKQNYIKSIESHNQLAQEEANKQLDNKIQEATFVINNPLPAATLSVNKQSGNYHVVAGAFRIEENCDKKVEQLITLGYNARKIGINKYGLHQVAYASYSDRIDALDALNDIKSSNNNDAWLLVKQLD